MVRQKTYTPTNKRFQRHFRDIAGTSTKKGHLSQGERENDEVKTERGVLVRIEKAKIKEDGWEVEVGTDDNKKTYNCTNNTGMELIPDSIESNLYYTPKVKTYVDVSIDTVSKIYSITRIRSLNTSFIQYKDDKITIKSNTSKTSDEDAKITVGKEKINLTGEIKINGSIESDDIKKLEKRIEELEKQIKPLIEG